MGSKRSMLQNGLGELLADAIPKRKRFFDLFCGSGSVAGYVAQRFPIEVFAGDLQKYAVVLAASQIEQTSPFSVVGVGEQWISDAKRWLDDEGALLRGCQAIRPRDGGFESWRMTVGEARSFCADLPIQYPLARAYGGYYFSPLQAMVLDALRACLPPQYSMPALAALIDAASTCAAAPGHTAQPFGTNDSSLPHLANAWARDISVYSLAALGRNASVTAKIGGKAVQTDASLLTEEMQAGDVAFIDPPYSEVQYSRFYHVLEAVAVGSVGPVTGVGRYPALSDRPQSNFCLVTGSAEAFNGLMLGVAASGADAIVTFPATDASNGLSGELVEAISDQYFRVRTKKITSLFSTLGGNAVIRNARKSATELVLYLEPR